MRQIHRLILLSALSSMALATPAFGTEIEITSPANGDTIALGTNVGVTFQASGIGAAEERVGGIQFLVDGVSILFLGVVDGVPADPPNAAIPAPFEITWTPQEEATFSLTARVFDVNGTATDLSNLLVSVTVATGDEPDVPTIDSPVGGSTILTNSTITIDATATDNDGVITQVEFFVNGQSIGVDDNFPYSFEFLLPAPDTYLLDVVATDNTGFTTPSATTTITAIAGASPSVSITSPSTSTLSPNTEITITADAADSDGLIVQVEFFVNDVFIGADTSTPYSAAFIVPSPGSYAITAVATDNSGNATTSATVTITSATPGGGIGTSPTVSITSPEDGSSFTPGTKITISADAFDSDGLIDQVEFFINGSSIGAVTSFPFNKDFTVPSPGIYAITAVATDNSESSTTSSEVTVTSANVGGEGSSPPTVSILSPPDGVSFIPGSTLTLAAIASDPDGLVDEVEFFVNGVSVEIVRSAPFQTQFSLPTTGTFVITAVATDNSDNIGTSPAVTVTAGPADNETPRVVIDHPLPVGGGDTINDVSVASSMYLNATAIDPDSEIKEVRFFANGQLLSEPAVKKLGNQYSLFFDPITEGDYVFFAEAEDFDGNVGQSVPLDLEVGPLQSLFPDVELTLVSPIDPKVSVEDKVVFKVTVTENLTIGVGFSLVTFYADGVYIGIANPVTGSDTATFAWFPDIVGNFDITARVIQLDPNGFTFDNWIITDPVALSVIAVSENRVLLEQTVEDLLNDELTQEEADALVAELDSGQTNFSQAIEEIFQSDDSAVVQEALMARFLLSGAWPNHDLLFQDKSTIEQDGLSRLVEILIPAFQAVYWNNQNLPDAFSSDAERTDFIEILFNNKYGVAPNQDQINAILTRFVFLGSNRFIELFIQDNTVISFADGTLSQFLAIPNPPNDQLPRLADAASLLINLLRTEPSASEVSALEQQTLFLSQVDSVLADPRYDERFNILSDPIQIISGQGILVSEDNVHENGNIYDEIIMTGPSITVQARTDIITRVYFLDEDGDIVVTEFAGTGVLKITLDPAIYIAPAIAVNYNRPDVKYATGRAGFQIAESAEDTWFAVYTWGELNIPNTDWLISGFNYDGIADVAFLSVSGDSMAGILAGNAIFSDDKNFVGIHAPNVRLTTLVVIRDIDANGTATPYLLFGSDSEFGHVIVTGGDLSQSNGSAISVRLDSASHGFESILTLDGINSNGTLVPRSAVNAVFTTGDGNVFIRVE